MKILIIYNPLAGKEKKKDLQIKRFLKDYNLEIIWHYVRQGSFVNLNPQNFDRIFVAGGDGTVREAASWLISKKANVPLIIIPIGSGNILASSLGIPLEIKKALQLGFSDKIRKINVGLVNNKYYFLVAAGCGFDAKVIKHTTRKMKKAWGFLAYIFSLVFNFFNTETNKFFIKVDDMKKTVTAQSILVSNFPKFFNLVLNPQLKINDNVLNVSIIKTLHIKDLGILLYRFLIGKYKKDWRYEYYAAKKIYILPYNKNTHIQIDGEIVELPYLDIQIIPQALKIIANKLP